MDFDCYILLRIHSGSIFYSKFVSSVIQDAAKIISTFRKISMWSPKQEKGCGPFR